MFDMTEPQPRGFVGRPFLALVFSAGIGFTAEWVRSWFNLKGDWIIAVAIIAVVAFGYIWERLETPREN